MLRHAATSIDGGERSRLADQVALGVLTRTYPPTLVDRVLAQTGRVEQRHRLLPARLMVYYVLALALFADVGMVEVRCLVEALREVGSWRHPREPWRSWHIPATSALIQARARLGPEPLAAVCHHGTAAGHPDHPRGVVSALAADEYRRDLPGGPRHPRHPRHPATPAASGRAGAGRGERQGAFPQVRLVGLSECGTHAIVAAALGPYRCGEGRLADQLLGELDDQMLVMVDRGLWSTARWRRATATGAVLLWRVQTGRRAPGLPVDQVLADGSWRSHLTADEAEPIAVGVLDYRLDDPGLARRGGHGTRAGADPRDLPDDGRMVYRLVTSILDPTWPPPPSWPRCVTSGGRSRPPWPSSRSPSTVAGRCCVPRPRTGSGRRSGRICWSTTGPPLVHHWSTTRCGR